MDDRGANIDLVFRNGLKDFEVLPPPEVWDNIQPAIKVNPTKYIFLKAAAAITVVATLGFFAYRLSMEAVVFPEAYSVAMNIDAASPVVVPVERPSFLIGRDETPLLSVIPNEEIVLVPDNRLIAISDANIETDVPDIQGVTNISLDKNSLKSGPLYSNLESDVEKTLDFPEMDYQLIPEILPEKKTERWSISTLASPTYYSNVTSNKTDLSKQLAASEKSLMSYSGGVAVSYKINSRFSVQTGVYYSSMGQELEGVSSFSGFQRWDNTKGANNFEVLTSRGVVYTSNADVFLSANGPVERIMTVFTNDVFDPAKASLSPVDNKLLQKFSFVELPVFLRYKIIDKTIDFNVIGGFSYNMLVSNLVYASLSGDKYPVGETRGVNPVSLSSSIGMGMEYNFSKNLSFNIEPTLRYYINPFSNVGGTEFHPYSFGLFSGLSYKF